METEAPNNDFTIQLPFEYVDEKIKTYKTKPFPIKFVDETNPSNNFTKDFKTEYPHNTITLQELNDLAKPLNDLAKPMYILESGGQFYDGDNNPITEMVFLNRDKSVPTEIHFKLGSRSVYVTDVSSNAGRRTKLYTLTFSSGTTKVITHCWEDSRFPITIDSPLIEDEKQAIESYNQLYPENPIPMPT